MLNGINSDISSLFLQQLLKKGSESPTHSMASSGTPASSPTLNDVLTELSQMAAQHAQSSAVASGNNIDPTTGRMVAQSALIGTSQVSYLLQNMQSLAQKASSGTLSDSQLGDLNTEFQKLEKEINDITNTTTFGGIPLLSGTNSTMSIQTGNGSSMTIQLANLTTGSAGLGIANLDVKNADDAKAALATLTTALTKANDNVHTLEGDINTLNKVTNGATPVQDFAAAMQNANATKTKMLSEADQTKLLFLNMNTQYLKGFLGK